jgi:hypothetical protein
MKKILTALIFSVLFLAVLVSATVNETNYIYDGLILEDGSVTQGVTPVNHVSVIGRVCLDSGCTAASYLWYGEKNTGSSNSIVIQYPTQLQNINGYLIYFYKTGYIPYGVRVDWHGEGDAGNYNDYLRKVELGSAKINYLGSDEEIIEVGTNLTIDAEILSPMVFAKDWNIPQELEPFYKDEVKSRINITNNETGVSVFSKTKTVEMDWSSEKDVEFSWIPQQTGIYKIELTTEVTDDKFLDSDIESESYYINVTEEVPADITAPIVTIVSPIEGETYTTSRINITVTTDEKAEAAWYFADSDEVATYLENSYHGYTFTGEIELSDGNHTLKFRARDSSGNVANSTKVSFTIDTGNDNNNNNSSGGKSKVRHIGGNGGGMDYDLDEEKFYEQYGKTAEANIIYTNTESEQKDGWSMPVFIPLLIIFCILAMVVAIFIVQKAG